MGARGFGDTSSATGCIQKDPGKALLHLHFAGVAAKLAGNLEQKLIRRGRATPVGTLLPVPGSVTGKSGGEARPDCKSRPIDALRGQNVLIESTSGAIGREGRGQCATW